MVHSTKRQPLYCPPLSYALVLPSDSVIPPRHLLSASHFFPPIVFFWFLTRYKVDDTLFPPNPSDISQLPLGPCIFERDISVSRALLSPPCSYPPLFPPPTPSSSLFKNVSLRFSPMPSPLSLCKMLFFGFLPFLGGGLMSGFHNFP